MQRFRAFSAPKVFDRRITSLTVGDDEDMYTYLP